MQVIQDLHVRLINERRKNHDSLWSIHDDYDAKIKDRCYNTEEEYKSAKCEEMELVLFTDM